MMRCVNPRKLVNPSFTSYRDYYCNVPCGHCYACLANRRRGWLFRLQQENLDSVITLFCTLTYDELSVLKTGDCSLRLLRKKDLQDFIKRLANYESFKYYGIGEYGTHTLRPHYHVVFFFKSAPSYNTLDELTFLINDKWPFGFTSVSRATYRRLNYILHYHVRPKKIDAKRETFQVFSKGLGLSFLSESMINYLQDTKKTTIKDYNGNTYVIPRYYRKKLIAQGYSLDPPEREYNLDASRELLENHFHRPLWQIPFDEQIQYLRDRILNDDRKLSKYNNQDKFV